MGTISPKDFANLCLEAQRIHEESLITYPGFDEFLEKLRRGEAQVWEFGKAGFYQIDQFDAAMYATYEARVDIAWAEVIGYLNYHTWNDIQFWAERQGIKES